VCGICGFAPADAAQPVEPKLIRTMSATLRHRGPDGEGMHCAPGIGLGFRRLAIIDLAGGGQPLANEDGTLWLVCNGEISNYVELAAELASRGHRLRTGSDAEVILHLYEEHGADLVHQLRGMFAFALWDGPRRRLLLARDRPGMKPLYLAETKNGLLFASEYKAILASGLMERRIDPAALRSLFEFGFVREPATLAAGVVSVPAGSLVLYEGGCLETRRYWQPSFPHRQEYRKLRARDWAEALRAKLEESVALHLRSDVEVGAWLSPGLDSSSIAALARRSRPDQRLLTFSLAFSDPATDEVRRLGVLSDDPAFGLTGRTATFRLEDMDAYAQAVWHVENPSLSAVEMPRMALAALAATEVKVVLTGEGADEVFGGYTWLHGERLLRHIAVLPAWARQRAAETLRRLGIGPRLVRLLATPPEASLEQYRALIGPSGLADGTRLLSPEFRGEGAGSDAEMDVALPDGFAGWHPFCQLQFFEMTVRLPSYIERHLDRTAMAHSLETRVPFLDHEVMALASEIPPRFKQKWTTEKDILRRAMAGVLPRAIARRRKQGLLAPVHAWMQHGVPESVAEAIAPDALRKTGYFDPATVAGMARDPRGQWGSARYLFGVAAVQAWHRLFIEGQR